MNQQVRLNLLGRAKRQFHMRPVHGIPGLKGNHSAPSKPRKLGAQLPRSEPEGMEIVMRRFLRAFQTASHIPGVALVQQVIHSRMGGAGALEN
jgi:hypothetical protein